MRAATYNLISTDAEVIAVVGNRVYLANTVDALKNVPAVVIRWLLTEPAPTGEEPRPGSTGLQVWVHDRGGDYGRINTVLNRCKVLLTEAVHVSGSDGNLVLARWAGDSEDLKDDGYGTLVRYSTFQVLSS